MSIVFLTLMQLAVLAYALVGGVFLAFSASIMRSLARTDGVNGVEAMQVINREVFRWIFMTLFLGMAAASVLIVCYAAINLNGAPLILLVLAGLIYLGGRLGVTLFCNVPINKALADMELSSEATTEYWTGIYLQCWTRLNTVRTGACVVSAAMLLSGLVLMAQSGA